MAEEDDPDDAWLFGEGARAEAPRAGVARRLLESSAALRDGLAAYETREGQLAMMDAVERALAEDRHLFVEAGTGTGKTLAYLVPALLSARRSSSAPRPSRSRSRSSQKTCRSRGPSSRSTASPCGPRS